MAIWIPNLDGRHGPKYLQIVDALADDIRSGALTIGSRLPPHRDLAYQLALSPNTTSRAYAEGIRRALLRGEVGRGTFVRETSGAGAGLPDARDEDLTRADQGPIDLSRNLPFPGLADDAIRPLLAAISREQNLGSVLDSQTEADSQRHASAACAWLASQGVPATTDTVAMTVGAQHGLLCCLMAILRRGDLLLCETLTYGPLRAMADRLGLKLATVAMDERGLRPDAFADLCRHAAPRALYLTPTIHYPTAVTLSAERRQAIADIACRHGVFLIEDDVYAPLKADRPPAIATLAAEQTLYLSTLSKAVAPGLRIGYIRAPQPLMAALRHAISLSVWMPPALTTDLASRLILSGVVPSIIDKHRTLAAHRQHLARTLLGSRPFGADPHGLHIWLPLPDGWRSDAFCQEAARQNVLLTNGRDFCPDAGTAPEAVRLCLSHERSEARLIAGLRTVASLLDMPPIYSGMTV